MVGVGRGGRGVRVGASRALVTAYLRIKEDSTPFGVHPPAVVAGHVELERCLPEGAAIAQDQLGVARFPDPRLVVAIQPLPWVVVAPRNVWFAIGLLRTYER